MKKLSEKTAIGMLSRIRSELTETIRTEYEHRARSCETCETKGACCLDAHFVNVRITRLEAAAIVSEIDRLPMPKRAAVRERIVDAVEHFDLEDEGNADKTYACPLFERDAGCLVHDTAKPLPCIVHACYERKEDLPPEHILRERESRVFDISRRTYSSASFPKSLPAAIKDLL
jgi:hypothetical protein